MRGDDRGWEGGTEVEARIDAALRSYGEPGEMVETRVAVARVLERVRSDSRRRVRWWVWGAVTAGCLAVAVGVGAWMMGGPRVAEIAWAPVAPGAPGVRQNFPQRLKPEPPHGDYGAAEAVPLQSESRNTQRSVRNSGLKHEESLESLPKMEVFPAPRSLSTEEQALVAFATHVPAEVKAQVVEAEQHVGDPIAIAELKIAPLESGAVQDSKEQERDKEK